MAVTSLQILDALPIWMLHPTLPYSRLDCKSHLACFFLGLEGLNHLPGSAVFAFYKILRTESRLYDKTKRGKFQWLVVDSCKFMLLKNCNFDKTC